MPPISQEEHIRPYDNNRLLQYSIQKEHLKSVSHSTRWKSKKRQHLYIHTRWSIKKSSCKKNLQIIDQRSCIYMAKEKIQYILLIYQLYNLVGHRFRLLYKLDKLVMVTSRTHAIAKDTYLSPRLV